jgi:aspartate racemase
LENFMPIGEIPCNTAHLWYEQIRTALDVPMLHLVDVVLEDAKALLGANSRLGLLATDARIASGLYIKQMPLDRGAICWLLPIAQEIMDWVTPGIQAVRAEDLVLGQELFVETAWALR